MVGVGGHLLNAEVLTDSLMHWHDWLTAGRLVDPPFAYF
jgi:hypothetical protein